MDDQALCLRMPEKISVIDTQKITEKYNLVLKLGTS